MNLLELRPSRNIRWEMGEDGFAVLLVPKFRNRLLAEWLMPRLAKPYFRVKLDALGSFVWQRCDGSTPVEKIAEEMKTAFGNSAEPVHDRIAAFLRKLEKEKFLTVR